jgi:CzcA family heavy metal efflux pump
MLGLLRTVVRWRGAVVLLYALGFVAALWRLRDAPLDVLPAFAPDHLTVQAEAPGFDVSQTELLVLRPLETALAGTPGLEAMRSRAIQGLAVIELTFPRGGDPYRTRNLVAEAVAAAIPRLPPGVGPPSVSPLTSATMDVLKIGLVSNRLSPMQLRTLADIELKPALLAVPGVARVNVFGGQVEQLRITADPARLTALGIGIDQVAAAAQAALSPQPGGFVETGPQRLTVVAPLAGAAELAAAPVARAGSVQPVPLGEVASITAAPAPAFGDALVQGRPGVLLSISGQYGANTLAVTRALDTRVAELSRELAKRGVQVFPALHRPANFVETSLSNLSRALGLGAALVAVVLVPLLRSWRAALISFLAVPVSLAAAALVLWGLGYALDTMTLGGFAVALGVLIDDAIVDVENILRRAREDPPADQRGWLDTVVAGSAQIRRAVIYATLVVVLVFVPILFQSGIEGAFLGPLAAAFIVSVGVSLVVAFTLTPALAALLLRPAAATRPARWLAPAERWQGRAITGLIRRAPALAVGGVVLFAGLLAATLLKPAELVPAFREGHFVVGLRFAQPGLSLGAARRVGESISADLLKLPFIATVEQQLGRAEAGEDTWPADQSEFHIELKSDPSIDQEAAQNAIRDVLKRYPGVEAEVLTFLGDRLSETLTGETTQGVVELRSESLPALADAATKAAAALAKVPGASDIATTADAGLPTLELKPIPGAAALAGVDPALPPRVLRAATTGLPVGNVYDGPRAIPVVVALESGAAGLPIDPEALTVSTPRLGLVRLSRLATLEPAEGLPLVRHDALRRIATVGFNARGRPIEAVSNDARAALARAGIPTGVDVRVTGQGEGAAAARIGLGLAFGATILLVGLTLIAAFQRRAYAGLAILTLPFALIGGLAALLLAGLTLGLGAAVGLITVFGVGVRNSVLLLANVEDRGDVPDAALAAAADRFLAVVATVAVAALALLPLALNLGAAGAEIEGPLALTVLGGLVTATPFTLLLLPALAARKWRAETLPA